MPSTYDFAISSIQATIFTPGLSFIASKILVSMLGKYGERFDASPISMPLPPDAPPEIPRIILKSSDNRYKLELSSLRANLFWHSQGKTDQLNAHDFLRFATSMLLDYMDVVNAKVSRMASVINRYFEQETPGMFLSRHFCKDRWIASPIDNPNAFEIHSLKKYKLAGAYDVNSWVRCKTGFLMKPEPNQPIVLIEQDINTPSETMATSEFGYTHIQNFFELLPNEFDSILSLYFPEEKNGVN